MAVPVGSKMLMVQGVEPNEGLVNLTGGTFDTSSTSMVNAGQVVGHGILRTGGLSNEGSVTLTGGATTVNGNVVNEATGQFEVAYDPAVFTGYVENYGTFKVTDTTVVFAGGGTVTGLGGVIGGTGTITGGLVNALGTVAPGNSAGTLSIDGDFSQSGGGTLAVELADADLADLLAIDGTATLDGTLEVLLLGGYAPVPGQEWMILSAVGGISGSFAGVTPGYQVSLASGNTELLLSVPLIPGDFDGNGIVDRDDLAVFLGAFGTTNPGLTDMNLDGDCDRNDLAVFLGIYGTGAGTGEETPEPASAALVSVGLLLALSRRRYRKAVSAKNGGQLPWA